MAIGLTIFITFSGLLIFMLYRYERTTIKRRKITGRGGDFEE
jgi:hypothetical protein